MNTDQYVRKSESIRECQSRKINGIIKEEYPEANQINSSKGSKKLVEVIEDLYKNDRPHLSAENLKPNQIHQSSKQIKTEKLWKNYYRKPTTFVNPEQDIISPVNLLQDLTINL